MLSSAYGFTLRTLVRPLIAAVVALPCSTALLKAETAPDISHFTLSNGLEVVVIPDHRVPVVTHMVWYRVGSADEPPGVSGIAHFLEHLMFKGTRANPGAAFSALIAQNGGRDNAFTTEDYTVFHETVAKDRLDLAMRLEADRMTGLVLDDSAVLPERDVILEERRMRIDNDPSALLREQVVAGLYLNASYHNPTIGWEHEMRGLGTADALAFYRDWYAPNNAILIVAGDVEAAEVKTLAERHFGPIAARSVPPRLRLDEPPHYAPIRLEMKSPRAAQASWRRFYLAPSYRAGATQHVYALQILAEILAGSADSRLHKTLVLDKKLALSVGAGYSPSALGLAEFGVYATPKPGVAIADIEAAVDAELHRVLEHGVEAAEVAQAARRMQASAIYSQDSLSGPANIVGTALAIGRSLDEVAAWPDRIGAVTPAEVAAGARAVLIERNSATGILLPERTS
jgi:zinc protease